MSFLMHLDDDRVRMSAAGLFKVGKQLIPSVSSLYNSLFPYSIFSVNIEQNFVLKAGRGCGNLHSCPSSKLAFEFIVIYVRILIAYLRMG